MVNLYVMQDRVSGAYGSIFEALNDASILRDFKTFASNPNIPDYVIYDTVVIHLGSFDQDHNSPMIHSAGIPKVVFRGDDIEIRKIRERISGASDSDTV